MTRERVTPLEGSVGGVRRQFLAEELAERRASLRSLREVLSQVSPWERSTVRRAVVRIERMVFDLAALLGRR